MYGECTLCGRVAYLETHHIIPRACETPNLNINDPSNLIDICNVCHTKLTPTSLLTKYGMSKPSFARMRLSFYAKLMAHDGNISAKDVVNIFDDCFSDLRGA